MGIHARIPMALGSCYDRPRYPSLSPWTQTFQLHSILRRYPRNYDPHPPHLLLYFPQGLYWSLGWLDCTCLLHSNWTPWRILTLQMLKTWSLCYRWMGWFLVWNLNQHHLPFLCWIWGPLLDCQHRMRPCCCCARFLLLLHRYYPSYCPIWCLPLYPWYLPLCRWFP